MTQSVDWIRSEKCDLTWLNSHSNLNWAQLKYKTILKAGFSREWKAYVILSVKSLFNSLQTWSHVYCTVTLTHYFLISLITQHEIEFISLRLRNLCQMKDYRLTQLWTFFLVKLCSDNDQQSCHRSVHLSDL